MQLSMLSRFVISVLGLLSASSASAMQGPAIPETPAGKALFAFLDAVNTADPAKLDAYVKTYDAYDTVDDLAGFSARTGGFTLVSIISSAPDFINARMKRGADNKEVVLTFVLGSTNPPRVESWRFHGIPPGATIDDMPLDAAARKRVIDAISRQLTDYYVYPDLAQKMVKALQEHWSRGNYNSLANGAQFATALHADLLAVSNDHHIVVDYNPVMSPARKAPDGGGPNAPSAADLERARLEHSNCEFTRVEILPRNIGYLKFDAFDDPAICGPTVAAAMTFLAHTEAMIVDLRENGGGDPAMVQLVASYFLDHSTHINDLYNRHDSTTTQFWTLPSLPGPRITAPLFILTSKRTFSAAEEFCYDMQTQKRATIVGETTAGGAHPVRGMPAGDHFTIGVPFARPINPITKIDWEGSGVLPEVKVPAADALEMARKLAVERIAPK
jgi:hypothetical protein